MQTYVFSLYDMKTGIYGTPFFSIHEAHAVRMVADLAADLSTVVGRHPADYTLYCLGRFDDATGMLANDLSPVSTVPQILEAYRKSTPPLPLMVHRSEAGELARDPKNLNGELA